MSSRGCQEGKGEREKEVGLFGCCSYLYNWILTKFGVFANTISIFELLYIQLLFNIGVVL